jgi:hypothetical protein
MNTKSRAGVAVSLTAAVGVVVFYTFCEVVLAVAFPVQWYLPGVAVLSATVGLALLVTGQRAQRPLASIGAVGSFLLVVLFLVPWTSRKEFLRHLHRVETGMTRREAREVMLPYRPVGEGEVTADTADSYRHETQNPRYDSDVGLIEFEDGRVAEVKFLPD